MYSDFFRGPPDDEFVSWWQHDDNDKVRKYSQKWREKTTTKTETRVNYERQRKMAHRASHELICRWHILEMNFDMTPVLIAHYETIWWLQTARACDENKNKNQTEEMVVQMLCE